MKSFFLIVLLVFSNFSFAASSNFCQKLKGDDNYDHSLMYVTTPVMDFGEDIPMKLNTPISNWTNIDIYNEFFNQMKSSGKYEKMSDFNISYPIWYSLFGNTQLRAFRTEGGEMKFMNYPPSTTGKKNRLLFLFGQFIGKDNQPKMMGIMSRGLDFSKKTDGAMILEMTDRLMREFAENETNKDYELLCDLEKKNS